MHVPVLAPAGPNETYASAIAPPPSALRQPRSTRRLRAWAALAAATVGAAAATAALALRSWPPRSDPPQGTAASTAPAAPAAVERPTDPAPERIHVVVRASPADARIVVDRDLVMDNPCVMTFPRDGGSHTVRVEADGYAPRQDTFDAKADLTLVIGLERRDVGPRTASLPTGGARSVPALAEPPRAPRRPDAPAGASGAAPIAPPVPLGVTSPQPTAATPSARPSSDPPPYGIDLTDPYGE